MNSRLANVDFGAASESIESRHGDNAVRTSALPASEVEWLDRHFARPAPTDAETAAQYADDCARCLAAAASGEADRHPGATLTIAGSFPAPRHLPFYAVQVTGSGGRWKACVLRDGEKFSAGLPFKSFEDGERAARRLMGEMQADEPMVRPAA